MTESDLVLIAAILWWLAGAVILYRYVFSRDCHHKLDCVLAVLVSLIGGQIWFVFLINDYLSNPDKY